MNEFEATASLILLFALRCALPAVLIFGIGYLMNKWGEKTQATDGEGQPVNPEFCPSFLKFGKQCWSARMREEGALPAKCVTCSIYKHAVSIL